MKLRLKDILQEGPGRPEGPGPENIHHFPHHGLYGRTGGMKPKFDKFGPYGDPTADIRTGDEVAEETPESEEELPENYLLSLYEDAASREYLKSLNLKQLGKDKRPEVGEDPRQFYQNLKNELGKQAESGPVFDRDVLQDIGDVPFPMDKKETQWFANIMKSDFVVIRTHDDIRYILDFIRQQNVDINTFRDFDSAFKASQEWHETLKNKQNTGDYKTNEVEMDFGDGFKIVKLSAEDCEPEGDKMGHCVGGYDKEVSSGQAVIYSLRDKDNEPHVTIDYRPDENKVTQIYGKGDKRPIKKYWPYIFKFIDSLPNVIVLPVIKEKEAYRNDGITYGKEISLKYLYAASKDESSFVRQMVASSPSCPPGILIALSKDKDEMVRTDVAYNSNSPLDLVVSLSKDGSPNVRSGVAANPNCPPELILALSKDGSYYIRSAVATNPSCPPGILIALSKDKNEMVKRSIALNSSSPPEALLTLSEDEDGGIRSSVVQNPNLPPEILINLSTDHYSYVKYCIVRNPNVPREALLILSKDEDPDIRYLALSHPNFRKNKQESLDPTNGSIKEFFKFTQSASDNTSFPRPPHQGSGFPAAYGKPLNAYGSYDPASNNKINKKRNQTIQGRADQKITKFDGGKEFAKKDLEFPLEDGSIKEFFLSEKTRADKEGVPEQDIFEYLKQFVSDDPKYFISFVAIPKLGINPTSKYNTPIGIYSYPLTSEIYNQFKANSLPFAGNQPYFVLFGASPNVKFFNVQNITQQDLENAKSKLIQMFPDMTQEIEFLKSDAKSSGNQTASQLWNITRGISKQDPIKWNATLRDLGYDAAIDLGSGLIHPSEPTQATFFSFKPIKVVNIFDNPYRREKIIKRKPINFNKLSARDEEAISRSGNEKARRDVAKFTKNKETLIKLSKDENYVVRSGAARNLSIPPEALIQLSKDNNSTVRIALAENPSVPPEVLVQLSKDEDGDVSSFAAKNPSMPLEVLVELSNDEDYHIRSAVAQNSSTPPEVLVKLSKDNNSTVRSAAVENPSVPPEALVQLSNDKNYMIRSYVAQNPSTPPEVLVQLSKDKDIYVSSLAVKNPNFPKQESFISYIQEMIAGRERIERDENDYSTKHAYKNGIPGSDKKDIYNSYERIDSFFKSLKREEQNDADNKKLEKQIRDKELEEAANSAYNKIMQRIMHSPQSDLGFFDILKRDNMYTMTDPEREHETEKKPKGFSAGKSKKGK